MEPAAPQPWPPRRTAWYAVAIFAVALMFANIDASIITLLVVPIERDLHLTDTQMSLLLGFALVFFYMFVGLPLSRFVDRHRRNVMLACAIGFWSLSCAACGVAQSFVQLFLCRFGIGAGESVNGPATYSLMADFFPPERLPKAIAALQIGYIAGTGLSLLVGAFVIRLLAGVADLAVPVIGTIHSWQLVFFAVGLPGLIVAGLMMTIPEPPRRGTIGGPHGRPISLTRVIGYLVQNWRVFAPMYIGLGLSSVASFGTVAWNPTFFQRTYGWSAQYVGLVLGITSLIASPLGLLIGLRLNSLFMRRGYDDTNIRVLVIAQAIRVPAAIAAPLMPNPWLAIFCLGVVYLSAMVGAPSQNAALQIVTPNEMRGQVTALYLFMFTVVGTGIGPTLIAVITDHVLGSRDLIRYSLAIAAVVLGPLSALIIRVGLRPYGAAVARLRPAQGALTS